MLVYVALVAPYRIGFGVDAKGNWLIFETAIDFLFMADVLINFRTGYYLEDEEVMDFPRVAKHYLTGWFLLDIVTCIPFDLLTATADAETSYAKLLKSGKVRGTRQDCKITQRKTSITPIPPPPPPHPLSAECESLQDA